MRQIISLLFISLLLSKLAFGIFWQVNFRLNQREIIRLECENKNRPELHCNGKCYLAKQLRKAELELDDKKQNSSDSFGQLKWLETSLFAKPEFPKVSHSFFIVVESTGVFTPYKNNLESMFLSSVFHPPCYWIA